VTPPLASQPATAPRALDGWIIQETRYAAFERMETHHHDGATLSIIFKGGYVERFGRRTLTGEAFSAILKPPQFAHENEMSPIGLHALYVELNPALIEEHCRELRLPSVPVALSGSRVVAAIARIRQELGDRDDTSGLSLESHLLEIVAQASRQMDRARDSARQPWLARVRARLNEAIRETPDLASLAADADVHPVHLAQAFRRRYGCTIGEYLRERRVDIASAALRGPHPISRIAHDTGFADHSHLTRVFRRAVGVTPTEYRRLVS
jgi:AraC family transcriptional regulator